MNNELKITATANIQQANTNLQNLQKTLLGSGQVVKRVGSIMDKSGNEISKSFTTVERKGNQLVRTIQRIDSNGQLRGLSQSVTDVRDKTEKTTSAFSKLKSVLSFTAIGVGLKSLANTMKGLVENSVDYSESLNLFNVVFKNVEKDGKTAFSEVGKQATEFQEKLQKNFGADRTESMYFQGLYQSMAESQGIADKYANIMSENSTKLTYDLSSLFNQNQKDTAEALRAGIYAGQTKPLRSYGLDITETSLQKTLDKLKETNAELDNLEVRDMSQAEKQILRYLTVLDQATVAQGDFANTIESPANQMKILTNQIREMGVALGNLLLAPLQKFLTFANTIVIVVKQVAQSIASLFGIKTKDYNTGIASAGDVTDDLSDSLDSAGSSADKTKKKLKELKRETLGFDQINNINEQKDNDTGSDSGSGGGSVGGINQALLDALKGYDNGLDKVRLKAQQIADQIMRWLGFTYDAEEGVWKLGSAYDNLIKSCKNLGKALDVLGKYSFDNLVNFYNNFLKPVAKWTLGKGLPEFVDITANGIMKTDWANLNAKLNNFYKALAPFTIHIGEGLLWFYKEVLVPLGSFTIGKVVPEFVDILANSLKILNNTIEVLSPAVDWLWQNFLKPIASWTGGVIVSVLKDFNSILNLISKNKALSTITALSGAFLVAKANGGVLNSVMGLLTGTFNKLTGASVKVNAKTKAGKEVLGELARQGIITSDSLSDTKQTGLGRVMTKLGSCITTVLSPLGKLGTSVKNASKEVGNVAEVTERSNTIFGALKNRVTDTMGGFSKFNSHIKTTVESTRGLSTQINNGVASWYNQTSAMEKAQTALVGVTLTAGSFGAFQNTLQKVGDEGITTANKLEATTGAIGTMAGAMITGLAVAGPVGAAVGALGGAFATISSALLNMPSSYGKMLESMEKARKKSDEFVNSLKNQRKALEDQMNAELKSINAHEQEYSQLQRIVDVNGRVKAGREDEAKFLLGQLNEAYGTNYQIVDGVIQQYGELRQTIEDTMAKEKLEIELQYKKQEYDLAIKNRLDSERKLNETRANMLAVSEELANAEATCERIRNDSSISEGYRIALLQKGSQEVERLKGKYDKLSNTYNEQADTYEQSVADIEQYQNLWVAYSENNYQKAEEIISNWDKNTYQAFTDNIIKQTQDLNGGPLSENLEHAWAQLAQKDHEAYKKALDKLPPTTQKTIKAAVDEISKEGESMKKTASKKTTEAVDSMNKKAQAKSIGKFLIQGLIDGMNAMSGNLLGKAGNLMQSVIKLFKKIPGINSPSKVTTGFGENIVQGFEVGFDKEKNSLYKQAENLTNGLMDKLALDNSAMTSSLNVDARQLVDVSEITGSLNTNTKMNFDTNFINNLGNVIASAINDRPIDVKIDARTEKGTIVETAIDGINDIYDRTGESPVRVF